MPDYPNPYDFVPLTNQQPPRRAWCAATDGMDRSLPERYSGRLLCLLHPETPLFVHGIEQQKEVQRRFFRQGNEVCIPATTLKGALRSLYEIVSDSCMSSIADKYQAPRSHIRTYPGMSQQEYDQLHPIYEADKITPNGYLPCLQLSQACPACLLFGMIERVQDGTPLAGRLLFSDAKAVTPRAQWIKIPAAGGGPHPWHSTFYLDSAGKLLGRKLYYHHRDYQETIALYGDGGHGGLIQLEGQQGDFRFTIDFHNLTEDELGSLVYTLALEPDLRHHLGYGKPYGLGSAQIRVEEVQLWERPGGPVGQRFLTFAAQPIRPSDIQQWVQRRVAKTRQQWEARFDDETNYIRTVGQFKRILHWPGEELYKYPSFEWFRRTAGSGTITLAEYQRGVREPNRGNRP